MTEKTKTAPRWVVYTEQYGWVPVWPRRAYDALLTIYRTHSVAYTVKPSPGAPIVIAAKKEDAAKSLQTEMF